MSTGDSTLESSTSGRHSTNLDKLRYLNQVSAVQCYFIFSCTWDFLIRSAIRLQKIVVQLLKPSLIMLSKFSIQNSNASLWYLLLKHPGLSIAWILLHSVFAFLFYFHFAVASMTYDLYIQPRFDSWISRGLPSDILIVFYNIFFSYQHVLVN